MEFLVPSLKKPLFIGEPFRVVHHCFFRSFHFTTYFYYCWLHLFISPTLGFFITGFSGVFISPLVFTIVFWVFPFHQLSLPWLFFFLSSTSFLCCFTASATDLREFFLLSGVFYLTHLPHICHSTTSATHLRELSCSQAFFTLHSFPRFGTTDVASTCIYQSFLGSQQFFLEGCRASYWGSKHRPGPSVCLNYTVFSKRY